MKATLLSFFKMGEVMAPMLGKHDLRKLETLCTRIETFSILLDKNREQCQQYKLEFADFSHLYEQDRNKEFAKFIHSEQEAHEADEAQDMKIPPLPRFQERIQFYKDIEAD